MTPDCARAIYELMMISAWADGRLEASEALEAEALQGEHPALREVPDASGMAVRARQVLDQRGLHAALLQAAQPLTGAEERELAFGCCARILEADGLIAMEEFRVLAELKTILALDARQVERALKGGSR